MSIDPVDPVDPDSDSDSVYVNGEEIDLSKIRGALDELREKNARTRPASLTGVVRAVLPELEAALQSGADYATVLAVLQNHGVSLTAASFETILARVRKEQRGKD